MSPIVDISQADDPRDVIHQAVQLLATGELVILPTESSFVVATSALSNKGIQQLMQQKDVGQVQELFLFVLALRYEVEAFDYFPNNSLLGNRLVHKKLPGSLTIGMEEKSAGGLFFQLPELTRNLLTVQNNIWVRVPEFDVISSVANLLPCPLVLMQPVEPVQRVDELSSYFGKREIETIIDSRQQLLNKTTTIKLIGEHCEVISSGSIDNQKLQRMTSENYLFVCTGNTCRSPMAEGLFRQQLADMLKCLQEDLPEKGFNIASAGLAAMYGLPASPESVDIVNAHDGQLQDHQSQPLTDLLIGESDWIFTMTRHHRDTILAVCPEAAGRVHLLAVDDGDISDPIGGGMSAYKRCEQEILSGINQILQRITENTN